jgi:hypothetical protein
MEETRQNQALNASNSVTTQDNRSNCSGQDKINVFFCEFIAQRNPRVEAAGLSVFALIYPFVVITPGVRRKWKVGNDLELTFG